MTQSIESTLKKLGVFRLIGIEELYQKYENQLSASFKSIYNLQEYPNRGLLISEDNVVLDTHLYIENLTCKELSRVLNIEGLEKFDEKTINYTPTAIIVLGNLIVNGFILNMYEYIPFLYVKGNVVAMSLLAGNSSIVIQGNLDVKEVLFEYYNEGMLEVNGKTTASLYIEDQHLTNLYGGLEKKYKSYAQAKKEKALAPKIDRDQIAGLLIKGVYIFAESAKNQPKDYYFWLNIVKENGSLLKNVPVEYMDHKMIITAISHRSYAFNAVPDELITDDLLKAIAREVPVGMACFPLKSITKEIAILAVQASGSCIGSAPFGLVDKEMCYLAAKNGATFYRDIPTCYWDVDLLNMILEGKDQKQQQEIKKRYNDAKAIIEAEYPVAAYLWIQSNSAGTGTLLHTGDACESVIKKAAEEKDLYMLNFGHFGRLKSYASLFSLNGRAYGNKEERTTLIDWIAESIDLIKFEQGEAGSNLQALQEEMLELNIKVITLCTFFFKKTKKELTRIINLIEESITLTDSKETNLLMHKVLIDLQIAINKHEEAENIFNSIMKDNPDFKNLEEFRKEPKYRKWLHQCIKPHDHLTDKRLLEIFQD